MKRRIRWRLWLAALCGLFVVVPSAVLAQVETAAGGKFRAGNEVEVGPDETVDDDIYVAAGTVRVAGTVNGDVLVSGGQVDVGGRVTGDLIVLGGTVTVDGDIAGDARVAAGQMRLAGAIGEDLVVTTGTLALDGPSQIAGDLVFSTGQTVINGTIDGDVLGTTGDYRVAGEIGGDQSVVISETREPTLLDRVWSAVRRWVSLVLVAALLLWLAPGVLRRGRDAVRTRALPAAGIGVVGVVGVPVVLVIAVLVIILAAVVLGLVALSQLAGTVLATGLIAVAAATMVFIFMVVFVAQVIVSLLIGGLVSEPRGRRDELVAVALGALGLVVLFMLPVAGRLLEFLVVLVGLGALVLALWSSRGPSAAVAAAPPSGEPASATAAGRAKPSGEPAAGETPDDPATREDGPHQA